MSYRPISDNGVLFIKDICKNTENIFTIQKKLKLPKSNALESEAYTAVIVDGIIPIDTSDKYADYLIKYINQYSQLYVLDANFVAAQIYIESKYSPVYYNESYKMGISGLIDYEFYKHLLSPSDDLTEDDVTRITTNITVVEGNDVYSLKTYLPNVNLEYKEDNDFPTKSSDAETNNAIANRKAFFQNVINNPYLSIFTQCVLLSTDGSTNKNLASSSLLNYFLRSNETSSTYMELVNKNKRLYGDIDTALKYVDDIFRVMSGQYSSNLKYSFGKEYNFNFKNTIVLDTRTIYANGNEIVTPITEELLVKLLPRIPKAQTKEFLGAFNKYLDKFFVNTRIRIAHYFAQIGHESGDLRFLVENLNYSAASLIKINPFNKHFKTISDTIGYANNPEKIANIGYGGRNDLGNGSVESGDGYKFRGRGAIQITGRKKYANLSVPNRLNVDLENNPDLLSSPDNAISSSLWEWKDRNLNTYSDLDDVQKVSTLINGGKPANGIDDRIKRLRSTKLVMGLS